MQTYIAILRGINVSGHKIIKMAELRDHLASLGFSNLATYIQSGNIVFQAKTESNSVLEEKIHQIIKDNFGFDVPVIVRTLQEWEQVVKQFPFNMEETDIRCVGVSFLKEEPTHFEQADYEKYKAAEDEIVISKKEIYLLIPDGFGNSKLTINVFEKKLKVAATTRNWNSTVKLLAMAQKIDEL
jgi:uncharacterized protein (DUF1697 family)